MSIFDDNDRLRPGPLWAWIIVAILTAIATGWGIAVYNAHTTDTRGTDAEFQALGFAFGDPAQGDPMFRAATLPPGWTKHASDHDMWSHIDDELGRERVRIFYKAAFMDLTSVSDYLHSCVYYGRPIVTDGTWATAAAVRTAALEYAESKRERVTLYEHALAREDAPSYAAERLVKARAELAVYVAIAAQHSDGADA